MAEEIHNTPPGRLPEEEDRRDLFPSDEAADAVDEAPEVAEEPAEAAAPDVAPAAEAKSAPQAQRGPNGEDAAPQDSMAERLERLGGEPAPAISPEEFARLQQAGQIHINSRGRIRTTRREETEAGMSLRKRRAWYAA